MNEQLHAAFTTSPSGRRVILRPVETGRALEGRLSPINREWELRVDEATGAEYWFSNKTHNTLTEPPLIEDMFSPIPTLLREAEENGTRVQLGFRPDPVAGDEQMQLEFQIKQREARRRKIAQSNDDETAPALPSNAMTWLFNKKIRPKRVRFEIIHRRFESVKPIKRAFERVNLVQNGTSVMFYSDELKRPVLGVVENGKVDPSNDTTMARRSNGVAFYRVKVIRMSKRDRTKISKKPPIYVSVEASYLEQPKIFKERIFLNAMNKLNMYTMAHGWGRWVSKCRKARHKDYKHECARKIQKKWNVGKLKLAGVAESALILKYRREREAELERRRKIAEKKRKAAAYKEYTERVGITPDGVNYFLTKREMQMFLYKRSQVLQKVRNILSPFWEDQDKENKTKAMKQWKRVWRDETAHYHKLPGEDEQLANIPIYRAQLKKELGYWHGAQENRIPKKLPDMGVHPRTDGTLQIMDLKRWQQFQEHVNGPTDFCNWMLRPRMLFGAYPEGVSRLDSTKLNARTPCINSLGQAKIACYVCLLTPEEEAKRENFEAIIGKLAAQQEVVLAQQVKSRRARVEAITRTLDDATKAYALWESKRDPATGKNNAKTDITPEMLEKSQLELNKATKSLQFGEETLEAWPAKPEFIRKPLPAPTPTASIVYDPETLLDICKTIEDRLRRKQRIYIFSGDGHGRAGVIAACIFARLHGLTGHDALSRVQRTFDSRGDILHRNKKRRKGRQLPKLSCPKHHVQRVSVLRFIDGMEREMFRDVSRTGPNRDPVTGEQKKGKGYAAIYTRIAVRNQGVPYMEEPQRVLFKNRLQQWWEHRERLLDDDMQAQVALVHPLRNPDLILQDDKPGYIIGPGFKNVWTPRTRLKHIPKRNKIAIQAQKKFKKGRKAVMGAVRMNIFGKNASKKRTKIEKNAAISNERKAKKAANREAKKQAKKNSDKAKKKLLKERKKAQKGIFNRMQRVSYAATGIKSSLHVKKLEADLNALHVDAYFLAHLHHMVNDIDHDIEKIRKINEWLNENDWNSVAANIDQVAAANVSDAQVIDQIYLLGSNADVDGVSGHQINHWLKIEHEWIIPVKTEN